MCEQDDWSDKKYSLHILINSCASKKFSIKKIKNFIYENNSDVNLSDTNGITPLHEATIWSRPKIVKLLIKLGANINAQDKNGLTPLMNTCDVNCADGGIYWINNDRIETAKILVKNGADINIKCYQGKTASDYAKEIYFARGLYYLLNKISEDISLYPILSFSNLERRVIIKPKKDMKYYFLGEQLQEGNFEPIKGVLSSITNSFMSFDFNIGKIASDQMLRIDKMDTNGIRTWEIYQVHHDDVDVEFLPDNPHHIELPHNLLGHVVQIRSKQEMPICYTLDSVVNVLKKGDTLLGKFRQITFPINSSEKAYFNAKGGDAVFYSDEIVIEKSSNH